MPDYTDNYNLEKPTHTEFYGVDVQNGNMEKIDTQMKILETSKAPLENPNFIGATITTPDIGSLYNEIVNAEWVRAQGYGKGSPDDYICTVVEDDFAIQTIVNNFFANGTAMAEGLKVHRTMGLTTLPINNRQIEISATNTRGAVFTLDFSNCYIPYTTKNIFAITSNTVKMNVIGLSGNTPSIGIYLLDGANNTTFTNCSFVGTTGSAVGVQITNGNNNTFISCKINGASTTGGTLHFGSNSNNNTLISCKINDDAKTLYGIYLAVGTNGIISFIGCKIMGTISGFNAATTNTEAVVKITDCLISGSTYAIQQTSAVSTMKWNIKGCSFSTGSIYVNGVAQTVATTTANAHLSILAYNNLFSQTIS